MPESSRGLREFFVLLRDHKGYRLLMLANGVSQLGDLFGEVALVSIVSGESSSAWAISGLFTAMVLPVVLSSPISGVVADRFDRRRIMIVSDIIRMLILALALAMPRTGGHSTALLLALTYTIVFVLFGADSFFTPARSALMPSLLPSDKLSLGNMLMSSTWSITRSTGGALAGLMGSTLGALACLGIDAGTFALSALLLWALRVPAYKSLLDEDATMLPSSESRSDEEELEAQRKKRHGDSEIEMSSTIERSDSFASDDSTSADSKANKELLSPSDASTSAYTALATPRAASASGEAEKTRHAKDEQQSLSWLTMLKDGLRYVWLYRDLCWLTLIKSAGNFSMGAIETIQVRLLAEFAHLDPSQVETGRGTSSSSRFSLLIGLLYLFEGLGSSGPIWLRYIDREDSPLSRRRTLAVILVIVATSTAFGAWSPNVYVFIAANAIWAACESIIYTHVQTGLQLGSEDAYRGRVFSLVMVIRTLSYACGTIFTSAMIDSVGLSVRQSAWIIVGVQSVNAVMFSTYYLPKYKNGSFGYPSLEA